MASKLFNIVGGDRVIIEHESLRLIIRLDRKPSDVVARVYYPVSSRRNVTLATFTIWLDEDNKRTFKQEDNLDNMKKYFAENQDRAYAASALCKSARELFKDYDRIRDVVEAVREQA